MFNYLDGVEMTKKSLYALADRLGVKEKMTAEQWFEYREKHNTTPLAYAKNKFGVVAELYFDRNEGRAILV